MLRDYTEEMNSLLGCMEPEFRPESTSMYTEALPEVADAGQELVAEADQKLASYEDSARQAQFESDTLALARDVAQLGQLFREMQRSEQARRTEKILHARAQNTIGAAVVADWMAAHSAVIAGQVKEQLAAVDRAGLVTAS